jgi:predicted alpha/beta-hydrolase family hydrolase
MRKVYQNERQFARLPVAIILAWASRRCCSVSSRSRIASRSRSARWNCARPARWNYHHPSRRTRRRRRPKRRKPPEAAPEPQLAETQQQIPLSADLEVALGSGGALAGFGEIRSLTAAEAVQEDTFDVADLEKRPEPVRKSRRLIPTRCAKRRLKAWSR